MKLFVLGATRSGKTPLAQQICTRSGLPLFHAGQWATQALTARGSSMQEYVQRVTAYSVDCLKTDFSCSLDFARKSLENLSSVVIDGERNPFDFVHLFDPEHDFAILLKMSSEGQMSTRYETGLLTIESYLDWLLANGFIREQQYRRYEIGCLYVRERAAENAFVLELNIDQIATTALEDIAYLHAASRQGPC